MQPLTIRPATAGDLPEIRKILDAALLGSEDAGAPIINFFVAEMNGRIVGTIGLEIYRHTGLLRSAAVLPSFQKRGIGEKLVSTLIEHARAQNITKLVLLTTTAEDHFSRRGFIRVDRGRIRGEILNSTQFSGACPASAVVMEMQIQP